MLNVGVSMVLSKNGWFIVEHPIKMDELGVPLFQETFMFARNGANYEPSPQVGGLLFPWF